MIRSPLLQSDLVIDGSFIVDNGLWGNLDVGGQEGEQEGAPNTMRNAWVFIKKKDKQGVHSWLGMAVFQDRKIPDIAA